MQDNSLSVKTKDSSFDDSGAIEAVMVNTNQVGTLSSDFSGFNSLVRFFVFIFVFFPTLLLFSLVQFYKWFTDLESAMKSEVCDVLLCRWLRLC